MCERVGKGVAVAGGVAVVQPGNALQANADINDFDIQLFARAVVESLELHEHHVANFQPLYEVLDGGTQVATTSPHIFHKCDFVGIDVQCLSEPPVVEFYALLLEKVVLVRVVEHLNAHHDEPGVVSTSDADIVEVVESETELGTDEGVRWWVQFAGDAVGLETKDPGRHEVYIVAPASHYRVPLD